MKRAQVTPSRPGAAATAGTTMTPVTARRSTKLGSAGSFPAAACQWNESPQAQDPVAFGLSMVKPCFSIVSTKSMVAPPR